MHTAWKSNYTKGRFSVFVSSATTPSSSSFQNLRQTTTAEKRQDTDCSKLVVSYKKYFFLKATAKRNLPKMGEENL